MSSSKLRSYWKETQRPVYSAALILPFFVVYHAGIVFLQTTYINGADALIMRVLGSFSVNTIFASVLVLIGAFVTWHVRTRASWQLHFPKLMMMFLESLFFALALFLLLGWFSIYLAWRLPAAAAPDRHGRLAELVLYCGAGIYEELLFRGILLGLFFLGFSKLLGLRKSTAAAWGMIAAALLFALFHYFGPAGDRFTLNSFCQRFFAGIYFSALFVMRSFGTAAATHSLYDILVGLFT